MTQDPELPEVTNASPARATASRADDAALVERLRAGDPDAFGILYDYWFDRVHDLAFRILWDREAAADVAQDAFLSAWNNISTLHDENAFGGWLLRIAHNGALNRKRKEQRARPVDEAQLAVIERTQTRPEDRLARLDDPARVAEDTEIAALLWSAADALGDRDREVLDLTLRHNLPPAEIAEVIGVNRNAANQLVHRVKQRLSGAVGARMLWRDGAPSCSRLRAELVAADIEEFNADAVRVIERHTATCDDCDERRRTRLAPAALFSALPIMSVPFLKAKVAYALDAQGVAMQGSNAAAVMNGSGASVARFGRVRRILLGSGAAAAVVVGFLLIGTGGLDEDGRIVVDEAVSEESPTTARTTSSTAAGATTTPTTTSAFAPLTPTTTESTPTTRPRPTPRSAPVPTAGSPGPGAVVTTPPAVIAPPIQDVVTTTTPPSPTTTAPPVPIIRFTMTPLRIGLIYEMLFAPVLRWEVTGAAEVTVFGPGAKGEGASGSVSVCPGTVEILPGLPARCIAIRGPHTYTLEARAGGQLVGKATAELTVG